MLKIIIDGNPVAMPRPRFTRNGRTYYPTEVKTQRANIIASYTKMYGCTILADNTKESASECDNAICASKDQTQQE